MRKPALSVAFALLLALALTLGGPQTVALADTRPTASPRDFDTLAPEGDLLPEAVKAPSAILMDSRTGKALFEKAADERRYPASTTKIMTCLLALEKGKLDDIVTVGKMPALEKGSTIIDLKQGETMKLEELLYGLMLESGNDAAQAIAIHLAGSLEDFADMMNQKAQELGMTSTHYINPHGLNHEEHYTTARDMAKLAIAARKYPEFVKIVGTYKHTVPATNKHEERTWFNSNRLISQKEGEIYAYRYATGIKTGYTSAAQSALVSSAQQGDLDLVAVVLKDTTLDKWTDSITMYEYGFNFFATLKLSTLMAGQTLTVDVPGASDTDPQQGKLVLALTPETQVFLTDRKTRIETLSSDIAQFQQDVKLNEGFQAPVTKDAQVGTVTFSLDGQPVLTCKLTATRDVNAQAAPAPTDKGIAPKPTVSGNVVSSGQKPNVAGAWLLGLGILLAAMAVALFVIRAWNLNRRSARMRQYNVRPGSKRASTRRRR